MSSRRMLTAIPRANPEIFKIEKNLSLRKTREKNLRWVRNIGVGFMMTCSLDGDRYDP